MLVLQPRDPMEEEFPFNRWVQFGCLEDPSVRHRIDTVPLKKIYRQEYAGLLKQWRAWAKKLDVHFVSFATTEHVETVLSKYIAFRSEIFGK